MAADATHPQPVFEDLVLEHRDALARYCRRLGVQTDNVDDVVQQAFLSAWSALNRGTDVQAVRPWLYGIVRNEAIDAHRRARVHEVPLPETLVALGSPDGDAERAARVGETLRSLRALPEPQREALLGTAVHGRSHHAVATDLGVSDTAVRGLVYRARATLRAAAGAIVPSPALAWIARLLSAGGGESSIALKGAAAVVAAGALAGGTTAVVRDVREHDGARPAAAVRSSGADGAPTSGLRAPVVSATGSGVLSAAPAAPDRAGSRRGASSSRRGHSGKGPAGFVPSSGHRGSDSSSSGPGPGGSDDVARSGSSGGHGSDDVAGSDSSGGHGSDDVAGSGSGGHGSDDATGTAPSSGHGTDDTAGSGPSGESGTDDSISSSGSGDLTSASPSEGPGTDDVTSVDSSGPSAPATLDSTSGSGSSGSGSGSSGGGGHGSDD